MKHYSILAITCLFMAGGTPLLRAQDTTEATPNSFRWFPTSKREKAKRDAEKNKQQQPSQDAKKYSDLVRDAKISQGLVQTILKDDKLYFELDSAIFGKDLLLSNRISTTSNNSEAVAGQMITTPYLVRFEMRDKKVVLYHIPTLNTVDSSDPIAPSFRRNHINPVLRVFDATAKNGSKVVIDMTSFFLGGESIISPFERNSKLNGTVLPGGSYFSSVRSFPKNVEIKSVMAHRNGNNLYTFETHRSLVLLPEKPMPMRLQDNRVGYFSTGQRRFTTELDKLDEYEFIHRWRLEPKDSAAYFRGELVEPIQPIVFYVDTVFPAKWRSAVKAGVLDWNVAFEAAGFKNAIEVRDYPSPKQDPDFDPDDLRYSCVKYATTSIANAMGPSYIDPRSGEILNADVIWYHNVLSLLHNWRFTQTAAVDKRVRTTKFPDEVMAESMRYVAAHEIGHTLGLMHNMGASFAYTIDQLRDPKFTQKHGTTPSIMDYARNNYVAQPGDFERGVRLTPPLLGVYDIHAINWGYRLIPGAKSPREEVKTLNHWINEKKHDPMYLFGAQQYITLDPTAQTEDLSNDQLRAGELSISNLKYIMAHYEEWLREPGERDDFLRTTHREIISQFVRHLSHVSPYIGGRIYYENRQGDGKLPVTYISKEQQIKAIKWLSAQLKEVNTWLLTPEIAQKYETSGDHNQSLAHVRIITGIVSDMYSPLRMKGVLEGYRSPQSTGFSIENAVDEITRELLAASYAGRKLTPSAMAIENAVIRTLITLAYPRPSSTTIRAGLIDGLYLSQEETAEALYKSIIAEPACSLGHTSCSLGHNHAVKDRDSDFFRFNILAAQPTDYELRPALIAKLQELRRLFKERATSSADAPTRNFYKMWEDNFKQTMDV